MKMYLTPKSHECKGRFQISVEMAITSRRAFGLAPVTGSGVMNDHIDTETRYCIRNFRVTQIVCISYFEHDHDLTSYNMISGCVLSY
jgi:hypothetical protein